MQTFKFQRIQNKKLKTERSCFLTGGILLKIKSPAQLLAAQGLYIRIHL